jgi:hypothetical protein
MIVTITNSRNNKFKYRFERIIERTQGRDSIETKAIDIIKLLQVWDTRKGLQLDPLEHRKSLSLQEWNDLLRSVRYYTCSICGEYCPKGECVNKKFHFPNNKKA